MSVNVLKKVWPEWQIEETPLGMGSYGVVYKAVRRDHGVESYAAIKIISIPHGPSGMDHLRNECPDEETFKTYLQGIKNDFMSEIRLMESLKGGQNIVNVEDYQVVEKNDGIGGDIYIRMELLTPLDYYTYKKKLTEEEVIKLGIDICTALELCEKKKIIHRDVKPSNIFLHDSGCFKLGDFRIARSMENITGDLSQRGTPYYMAPEIANNSVYDARVDTYSLGIVLYRQLNANNLPFLDNEEQFTNPTEIRKAINRRLHGEELPTPRDASPAMADLILRACAYNPDMRFSSAAEMKRALISVSNGTYNIRGSGLGKTILVRKVENGNGNTSILKVGKKRKIQRIIAAVLVAALLAGAGIFIVPKLLDVKNARYYYALGSADYESENYERALGNFQTSLDIYRESIGEKNRNTADAYYWVGMSHYMMCDYVNAKENHQKALSIRRKVLNENDKDLALSYYYLGRSYNALGDFSTGYYREALDIFQALRKEKDSDVNGWIGKCYYHIGNFEQAKKYYQEAIEIYQDESEEKDTSKTGFYYNGLGRSCYKLGDYEQARDIFQKALSMYQGQLNGRQQDVADTYLWLGLSYYRLDDYEKAKEELQSALAIYQVVLGELDSNTAYAYFWIGRSCYESGDYYLALTKIEKSLDIRRNILGEEHRDTKESKKWIEKVKEKMTEE